MERKKKIIGAAMGNCVHVAGVLGFLKLAESEGYETIFLGPACSIDRILGAAKEANADIVAISYRLTPAAARYLFAKLKEKIHEFGLENIEYIFGGTLPVAEEARKSGIFRKIFSTQPISEVIAYLKGIDPTESHVTYPQDLLHRREAMRPFPLIRHHFGLPSVEETVKGIEKIAEAKVLDIISIAPDQIAQSAYFRQDEIEAGLGGAGGVPLRVENDWHSLYKASRRGNYPLLRSYNGTRDLIKMAKLLQNTIHNAWAAIPLCWYSVLDGRSDRKLKEAISENQSAIAWHAERNIPVEINEPHQWGLRGAHDTIFVAMAYISAYNAKRLGVHDYISQYMLNTPPGTSPTMDLAKMLAAKELISRLEDRDFKVYTQIRPGLMAFPSDIDRAKGMLASSIYTGMFLQPDIVHVVSFSEADHAATPDDIIESCKISRQVIENTMFGIPSVNSKDIMRRKNELKAEALYLIERIEMLGQGVEDPLTDPEILTWAVKLGILDAPDLIGNPYARGKLRTTVIGGACYAVDKSEARILSEMDRLDEIGVYSDEKDSDTQRFQF